MQQAQSDYEQAVADADPESYNMKLVALELEQAQLDIQDLQDQIASAQLVAPFAGQILSLNIKAGDAAQAYDAVGVLADPNALEITAELGSEELSQMALNQEAVITLRNRPGETFNGTVRQLPYPYGGTTVDTGDDDTAVHVAIEGQAASSAAVDLTLGELATVSIVLQEKENVLWLPPAAIRTYQGRDFVVVQLDDGSQKRVDVLLGIATDERVEIAAGLEAGADDCWGVMEPFILCENLVKIYKLSGLEVVALQGLNLAVQPGELMGIVGASGSGKSTLLNILGGLDRPSAGRVTINGRDLLKASASSLDEYRRTEVGFVWQQTARNLIPYLSAQANVELPMTIEGVGAREKRAWSRELLETVGLWEHRKHRLAQLSGGQQQRVAIAVALANRPKLLLGDEPTGEVDSGTAQEILALFRQMNEQYGLTTIIVTHDPQVARAVDRVVTIRDGSTSSETVRRVADTSQLSAGCGGGPGAGRVGGIGAHLRRVCGRRRGRPPPNPARLCAPRWTSATG